MDLCNVCRSIDVDVIFFGKPRQSELHALHSLSTLQEIINKRNSCRICSMIYRGFEKLHPEFLTHDTARTLCGWFDHSSTQVGGHPTADEAKKILEIQFGYLGVNLYFNLLIPPDNPVPLRGRTLKRDQAELCLVREWIHVCENGHGDCRHVWKKASTDQLRLRLIDVENKCLVPAPPRCDFVALSYVWGTAATLQTTKSNFKSLSRPGGIDSVQLPQTIADAMTVVKHSGLRYLWVDALCIIQDDDQDKAHQIQNMDSVYGMARFTIVAASGESAASGLIGVNAGSRNVEQVQEEVKPGVRLSLMLTGFDDKEKASSKWNTRAWTFQEALLSPRLLIFHNGYMTWECRQALWSEDLVPGSTGSFLPPQFSSQMTTLLPERLASMSRDPMLTTFHAMQYEDLSMYESAVHEYSRRQMSFQSDKINAFTGLANIFELPFKATFLHALPVNQLDTTLLWSATEPLERLPEFPSWTWAGWKGTVRYESINPVWFMPMVAWYVVASDLPDQNEGSVSFKRLPQAWESEGYVPPKRPWVVLPVPNPNDKPPMVIPDPFVDTKDAPPYNVLHRCLCFQTFCVSASAFTFRDKTIIDHNGKIVGTVVPDAPMPSNIETDKLEFAIVSECSTSDEEVRGPPGSSLRSDLMNRGLPSSLRPVQERFQPPLTSCRFLIVEKNEQTASRRGMGEITKEALTEIPQRRAWVYLQ